MPPLHRVAKEPVLVKDEPGEDVVMLDDVPVSDASHVDLTDDIEIKEDVEENHG